MFVCRVFSDFLSVWCETKWNVWKHKFAEKKSCFIYLCRFIFFMGKYLQICAYLTLSSCAHISLCVCVSYLSSSILLKFPSDLMSWGVSTSAVSPPTLKYQRSFFPSSVMPRNSLLDYKHQTDRNELQTPLKNTTLPQKHKIKQHKKSSSVAVVMLTSLLPR